MVAQLHDCLQATLSVQMTDEQAITPKSGRATQSALPFVQHVGYAAPMSLMCICTGTRYMCMQQAAMLHAIQSVHDAQQGLV